VRSRPIYIKVEKHGDLEDLEEADRMAASRMRQGTWRSNTPVDLWNRYHAIGLHPISSQQLLPRGIATPSLTLNTMFCDASLAPRDEGPPQSHAHCSLTHGRSPCRYRGVAILVSIPVSRDCGVMLSSLRQHVRDLLHA